MQFSKVAAGSVVLGALILIVVGLFAFPIADPIQNILAIGTALLVGGLLWAGLILVILGLLMMLV